MKSFIILGSIGATIATLTSAAVATDASTPQSESIVLESEVASDHLLLEDNSLTVLEQQAELAEKRQIAEAKSAARAELVSQQYDQQLYDNQILLEDTLSKVISRAGKTRYVFSGASTSGWDCSGLTLWAYAQMGIDLPHSASQQNDYGVEVTEPKPGDLVLFGNDSGIFHAALYVGNNKVVHAGFKPGRLTEVISLDNPAFEGTTVTFRRLLELP